MASDVIAAAVVVFLVNDQQEKERFEETDDGGSSVVCVGCGRWLCWMLLCWLKKKRREVMGWSFRRVL